MSEPTSGDVASGNDASPARPTPGPRHSARHSASEPEPARHPRRWFLAGAGAAVLAAAGGVGAALLRKEPAPDPDPAPAPLLAAIAAERALLADLDATTGGTPQVRRLLVQVRADHSAHLQALRSLAAAHDLPGAASSSTQAAPGTPRSAAQLRAAENRAAATAAGHAAALEDRAATLLASISACEASHAELLS